MPIPVSQVSSLQTNTTASFGSPQISMDLTEMTMLAAQMRGNGGVRKNIDLAVARAIDRGSRRILQRLKANVNVLDSHVGKFDTYASGGRKANRGYFHPYSRTNPTGSLGHDIRLVHRLTQNMRESASIFGPTLDGDQIFADIGWDSSQDGAYIKYVVTGTRKMVPRDVLGLTIEETQQDVVELFIAELGLVNIFEAAPGSVSFGGFSTGFSQMLSMI